MHRSEVGSTSLGLVDRRTERELFGFGLIWHLERLEEKLLGQPAEPGSSVLLLAMGEPSGIVSDGLYR